MKCRKAKQILRRWYLSSKKSFSEKFMAKVELASFHAVDCNKCGHLCTELADERARRGLNGPNDEYYR